MLTTEDHPVAPTAIPSLDYPLILTKEETLFLGATITSDEEELRVKLHELRKRGRDPYPCIRSFQFAKLFMASHPLYAAVVMAGQGGNTLFLDLGCMMGTDVRKLVFDGYPAERVYGCDLRQDFLDMGYGLFGDREACAIRFFAANIFDGSWKHPKDGGGFASELERFRSSVTHIYTGALFHLFDEERQYELALRLATLLEKSPGALIFGRQRGTRKEGTFSDGVYRNRYGHSEQSWAKMWKKVFAQVGVEGIAERIVVQAQLIEEDRMWTSGMDEAFYYLYWSVQIEQGSL